MSNTELTLDQLQAVAGGATAIEYGLMAALLPKAYPPSIECKVPSRGFKSLESRSYQVDHY